MRKGKVILIVALLSIILLLFTGCSPVSSSNNQKPLENNKPVIYVSVYPMYDFIDKIGKDKIDLRLMVPPGVEPHDWEPTAKMMSALENADAIIYNGVNMEPWMDKILAALDVKNMEIVETSQGIELLPIKGHFHDDEDEDEDDHDEYDPHLWLDPLRAKKQAENIKNAMIIIDSDNKEFYESNYVEFTSKLEALDKKYTQELQNIKRKEIIVSHAAFGYLTDRYGLEQISIMGLSPQEEPSAAKLAELTKEVKRYGIHTIFFETLTNPKLSQVLAKEVGATTSVLHPVDGLTVEELQKGMDYFSLMEKNLEELKKALGE